MDNRKAFWCFCATLATLKINIFSEKKQPRASQIWPSRVRWSEDKTETTISDFFFWKWHSRSLAIKAWNFLGSTSIYEESKAFFLGLFSSVSEAPKRNQPTSEGRAKTANRGSFSAQEAWKDKEPDTNESLPEIAADFIWKKVLETSNCQAIANGY